MFRTCLSWMVVGLLMAVLSRGVAADSVAEAAVQPAPLVLTEVAKSTAPAYEDTVRLAQGPYPLRVYPGYANYQYYTAGGYPYPGPINYYGYAPYYGGYQYGSGYPVYQYGTYVPYYFSHRSYYWGSRH